MHNSRLVSVAGLILALGAVAAGQTKAAAPPRTPWGHPDLQGRWTNATVTPFERPSELGAKEYFTEAEAAEHQKGALERYLTSVGMREEAALSGEFAEGVWVEPRTLVPTRRTSLIVGATGKLPPLTPEAQKRSQASAALRKQDLADAPEERTVPERCLSFLVGGPPLVPGVGYNSNYEIVQTSQFVAILAEQGYLFRIIPLDGRPHLNPNLRQWHGDSRGRWEGDTLVVETTNFNGKAPLRGSGQQLRLVERFQRTGADLLMYHATAEDPATWVGSWTMEVPMRKLDGLLYEFACHEGNRGLENILKAARATDPPR